MLESAALSGAPQAEGSLLASKLSGGGLAVGEQRTGARRQQERRPGLDESQQARFELGGKTGRRGGRVVPD